MSEEQIDTIQPKQLLDLALSTKAPGLFQADRLTLAEWGKTDQRSAFDRIATAVDLLNQGAKQLAVTDLPNPLNWHGNQLRLIVRQVTRETAARLGYQAIASAEATTNRLYFYALLAAYQDVGEDDDSVHPYLGYGLHMLITIDGAQASLKAELPFIAATATTTGVTTGLDFYVFGVDDVNALQVSRHLMKFTRFDVDAYGAFLRTRDELIEAASSGKLTIRPMFFSLPEPAGEVTAAEKIAFAYAVQSVAAGCSVDEAVGKLAAPSDKARLKNAVVAVYLDVFGIRRSSSRPKKAQVDKAMELLAQFGMNPRQ